MRRSPRGRCGGGAGTAEAGRLTTPTTRRGSLSCHHPTTVVADPAVDYVAELKRGDGGDIGIHGSIELARSLLRTRLVDELRLVVAPVLAHHERRLFDPDDELVRLELRAARPTPSGALLADYRVIVA